MSLLLLALLPFAGAALLGVVPNERRRTAAWLAGLVTLAALALVLAAAPQIFQGRVLRWSTEWLPTLGLTFGFRMDGLAWVFALLICGIGALIVLYAAYYLDPGDPAPRSARRGRPGRFGPSGCSAPGSLPSHRVASARP